MMNAPSSVYLFTRPLCGACQQLKEKLRHLKIDFTEIDGRLLTGDIAYTEVSGILHLVDILIRVQVAQVDRLESWPPPMPILVVGDRVAFEAGEIEGAIDEWSRDAGGD